MDGPQEGVCMSTKYRVVETSRVFTPEFLEWLYSHEPTKAHIRIVMEKIEQYEDREGLEFVSFFGKDFLVFRDG